jgi:predicted esterase
LPAPDTHNYRATSNQPYKSGIIQFVLSVTSGKIPDMKFFVYILMVVCFPVVIEAQQTAAKFIRETNYQLYLPEGYHADSFTRWPLMLFLHGSGESGDDITKVKVHGPPKLVDNGKKFPFIIVSPQSPVPSDWDIETLYQLLQHIKTKYRVNEKKQYCTGLSMGGFGTWAFAMKYPDEFAAIAPICGGGDTSNAWKLRNIPVWCFHGAKDDVVPPIGSQNMVKAVKRFNNNIRFTLYPDADHNSWDVTYNNDSLYTWLLAQSKFSYTEKAVKAAVLKSYAGTYIGPDKDTVKIMATINGLLAKPGSQTIPLKAAGENLFYFQPDKNMDIRFVFDKKKVTGLLFSGDRQLLYRKL